MIPNKFNCVQLQLGDKNVLANMGFSQKTAVWLKPVSYYYTKPPAEAGG